MSRLESEYSFRIRFGTKPKPKRTTKKSADNCGTGAGGFKEGNVCATGSAAAEKVSAPGENKEAQKQQQQTPEFKEFFDESVITVDGKSGSEPLVLYHGTASENIEVFDPSKTGDVRKSDWGDGVYFTPSTFTAETYSQQAQKNTDNKYNELYELMESTSRENGGRGSMYLTMDLNEGRITQETYDKIESIEKEWRAHIKEIENRKPIVMSAYVRMKNPMFYTYVGITDPYLGERAKDRGHDGVIITREGSRNPRDWEEILVFDADQIKSATGNDGNFDSSSPNINKSADNCGTGAGGFQEGNDCAAGDGVSAKPGSMREMVSRVIDGGGFTYNPATGSSPTKGFAVSPFKDREFVMDLSEPGGDLAAFRESLRSVCREFTNNNKDLLAKKGAHFGGWWDKDANKFYLDVSLVIPDRDEAMRVAKQNDQEAIFDLESMETISAR